MPYTNIVQNSNYFTNSTVKTKQNFGHGFVHATLANLPEPEFWY